MKREGNSINEVPDIILKKWQEIADLLAELFSVPAALIMRTENEYMEVFVSSNSENNPYSPGDKEKWYGLYCETVIKSQKQLVIPDATKDPLWDHNPDIKLGMICYMGVPINYPDKTPFGTLCVLDRKERIFSGQFHDILLRFKHVIELDISFLQTYNKKYGEYESLYKNIREGVFLTKPTGEILSANPEACRMLGMTEEEICNLGRSGVINQDDPNLAALLAERERTGMIRGEITFKRRDGSIFPADFTSSVFDYAPGDKRTVVFFRDVTERKQAEEKLRKSEEKYRNLFDNSLVGVFATRMSGEVIYANKALASIFEYDTIEDLASENIILRYKFPEQREFFKSVLLRDGIIKEAENTIITAKNNEREVLVSVILEGDVLTGFVVDNTYRTTLMNELRQKNLELAHLNATKDKFFSIISHDLRGPCGTILGLSALLSEELETFSDKEIADYIRNINSAAKNTYALLDNLLIWSRSQSGDIKLNKQNVNLRNLVEEAVAIVSQSAVNKKISIENAVKAEVIVFADKNTLNTVVRNLISNSVKYTNEKGSVNISSVQKNGSVEIMVSDTGIGMSKETLKSLFNSAESVSSPGTANESGTGLGLILCKEFIEQNGGSIWAESKPGKGSTFYFRLPYLPDLN